MKLVKILDGTVILPSFSIFANNQYFIPNSKSVEERLIKLPSVSIRILFKMGSVIFFPDILSQAASRKKIGPADKNARLKQCFLL